MIRLRPYEHNDQDAVLVIWWDSWHSMRPGLHHPTPFADWRARWVNEIVPAQVVVVAEDDDTVVGFAAAHIEMSELTQIFVAPRRKREGIGQRLLTWAQERMAAGFSLHTLVDNRTSRAFYRRHGLVEGDTRTNPINGMRQIEYRWTPPRSLTSRLSGPA
jgi:ribosomal protein S18 acetylase RimI-like enzyme